MATEALITAGLKFIYEQICALIQRRSQDRRERFEQLIAPTFTKFMEIHGFYRDLFVSTLDALPIMTLDGRFRLPGQKAHDFGTFELTDRACQYAVDQAREAFARQRGENDHYRAYLRTQAKNLFASLQSQPEKRYFAALILYFLENRALVRVSDFDREIRRIEESPKGAHHVWHTPSYRLGEVLDSTNDPTKLREATQESLDHIYVQATNVMDYYCKLRLDVYGVRASEAPE